MNKHAFTILAAICSAVAAYPLSRPDIGRTSPAETTADVTMTATATDESTDAAVDASPVVSSVAQFTPAAPPPAPVYEPAPVGTAAKTQPVYQSYSSCGPGGCGSGNSGGRFRIFGRRR